MSLARLLAAVPVLLACLSAPSAGQETARPAALTPEPAAIDFGDAFQGEVLWKDVVFRNTGGVPWPLASVETTCGCTAASIEGPGGESFPTKTQNSDPILVLAPGEAMTIKVKFDTTNKAGAVSQRMTVHSTQPGVASVEIPVSVRVSKAISISEPWVNLGQIRKTQRVEKVVQLESLEIGEWSVAGFHNAIEGQPLPSWLRLEALPGEKTRQPVRVVLEGDRPVGPVSARVKIEIDHDRIEAVDFTLTAHVMPNVTFATNDDRFPNNVNFDHLQPEQKVTRTVVVTNDDPAVPYRLQAVDVLAQGKEYFATEIRVLEEGLTYEVDVTVDGAIGVPFFRGSLVMQADHPDLPRHIIPFHGWVKK